MILNFLKHNIIGINIHIARRTSPKNIFFERFRETFHDFKIMQIKLTYIHNANIHAGHKHTHTLMKQFQSIAQSFFKKLFIWFRLVTLNKQSFNGRMLFGPVLLAIWKFIPKPLYYIYYIIDFTRIHLGQ